MRLKAILYIFLFSIGANLLAQSDSLSIFHLTDSDTKSEDRQSKRVKGPSKNPK